VSDAGESQNTRIVLLEQLAMLAAFTGVLDSCILDCCTCITLLLVVFQADLPWLFSHGYLPVTADLHCDRVGAGAGLRSFAALPLKCLCWAVCAHSGKVDQCQVVPAVVSALMS
jgi:hypothetical protein